MNSHARRRGPQAGFSLVELLLVLGIMITLSAAVFSLMASSVKTSTTAYEMSQAQQSVRTAQEYINRDLVVAGDGFRAISNIPVRVNFATDYLAGDPVTDPDNSNIALLGLITSDDEAAEGTPVLGSDPAVEVRPGTDRITILSVDETFPFVSPSSITISTTGDIFRIKASEALRMSVGAIYCLTSSEGATFGTLTAITGSGSTRNAIFGPTDAYGLNQPGTGTINAITRSGAQPTTLKRVQMIHYFVNEDGLLIRRVFGVAGGQGYTDGVIEVQF
ncbi:MAG: PilW family protein [Pyrinomonadaceae bacterium]